MRHRLTHLLPCLLIALPLVACGAQAARIRVTDLASGWSGHHSARECIREPSDGRDSLAGTTACEWAVIDTSRSRVRTMSDGAKNQHTAIWERRLTDSAEGPRVIDSLSVAFEKRGLLRHECPATIVPAGRTREVLWDSDSLVVLASQISGTDGTSRLTVIAVGDRATMPRSLLCHLKSVPDAALPPSSGTTPSALRLDMVIGSVSYDGTPGTLLTVIHYRTNAPLRDSASVREFLTTALGRPNSLLPAQSMGVASPRTTRIILRRCYTDSCPELGSGLPARPDDLVFVVRADGSWAPAPGRPPGA